MHDPSHGARRASGIIRTMPAAPDFRLYHGNALDVLAELLARELRSTPPGASLLEPDTILIPQPSMRRWLQATLAERHGIAANLRFLAPGEFVGEVLAANVPDHDDARTIDPSRLVWRLYAVLQRSGVARAPRRSRRRSIAISTAPIARSRRGRSRTRSPTCSRNTRRGGATGCSPGTAAPTATTGRPSSGVARRAASLIARRRSTGFCAHSTAPMRRRRADCRRACSRSRASTSRRTCCACMTAAARGSTVHFYLPTPTRKYWGDLRHVARTARHRRRRSARRRRESAARRMGPRGPRLHRDAVLVRARRTARDRGLRRARVRAACCSDFSSICSNAVAAHGDKLAARQRSSATARCRCTRATRARAKSKCCTISCAHCSRTIRRSKRATSRS